MPDSNERERWLVHYIEDYRVYSDALSLDVLSFAGTDFFKVYQCDGEREGYLIQVFRRRLATDDEMDNESDFNE